MNKRVKKLVSMVLTVCMLTVFAPFTTNADTYGDWNYSVIDGKTVTITKYCGDTETTVEIPSEIDGMPVTSIGDRAFLFCDNLVSITIPESVTSIGNSAFAICTALTSITIPGSVKVISYETFRSCSSLTSVTISEGVEVIGEDAFERCENLTNITLPDSITDIYKHAFSDTTYFNNEDNWDEGVLYIGNHLIQANPEQISSEYTIKEGTKTIADYAFSGCFMSNVIIPESVTSIGAGAFAVSDFETITIPDGVTCISANTFKNCTNLKSITIPKNVTSIGDQAFYNCESLTSITIPDSVTSIGDQVFYNCESLTSITIPDSVTSIGMYVFDSTSYFNDESNWNEGVLYIGNHLIQANPEQISSEYTIKEGTKTIANGAFCLCRDLENVIIPDCVASIGSSAFSGCSSLKSVTIPDGITTIGMCTFYDCYYLESITIPKSVTSIDEDAFGGCRWLTDVYYTGTASQWEAIDINIINYELFNAEIHYESTAPSPTPTPEPSPTPTPTPEPSPTPTPTPETSPTPTPTPETSPTPTPTPETSDFNIKYLVNSQKAVFLISSPDESKNEELKAINLFVAEYDEHDTLIAVYSPIKDKISDNSVSIVAEMPQTNNYKLFLWDKMQRPLMEAITDVN